MKGRDKKGRFEKYYIPWNFKDGKRLKRKYKRFKNKLMLNAHVVWLKYNKLDEIPKGYIIHHKDGNSLNDNIDNLILMKDSEHKSLHNKKAGSSLIHSPEGSVRPGNHAIAPSGTQSCANCGWNEPSHKGKGFVAIKDDDTGEIDKPCKKFIPKDCKVNKVNNLNNKKTTDKTDCTNCSHKITVHNSKGCVSCRKNYHKDFPKGRECKQFQPFPMVYKPTTDNKSSNKEKKNV